MGVIVFKVYLPNGERERKGYGRFRLRREDILRENSGSPNPLVSRGASEKEMRDATNDLWLGRICDEAKRYSQASEKLGDAFMSFLSGSQINPYLSALAQAAPPRRKAFISFFQGDKNEVDAFIDRWATREQVFISKALGVSDNDDFIDSDNTEYVMGEIRRRYLGDSTVTIVLIGRCTHNRRYVDWEIKTSLRQGEYTPNGLLAYVLPSAMPYIGDVTELSQRWRQLPWPNLPERLQANWNYDLQESSYARYFVLPDSAAILRQNIESAFWDRTNRANLIVNDADKMKRNRPCLVCGWTH
jgi:hypothetical protein